MNYAYGNGMQNQMQQNAIMAERMQQNKLLALRNMQQQNSYNNQMNRIFSTNPILNQPIVQNKQNQLFNQMKNVEEIELVKKLQRQFQNKEIDERELLRQLVIMPVKIEKKNEDVMPRYNFVEGSWEHEREVALAKKTNQPYKTIIPQKKNANDKYAFDYTQKITKEECDKLTIHKVTEFDKNARKFRKEHRVKKRVRKDQNKENKITYSTDSYLKHKQHFEIEHIYVFRINEKNSKSHNDLKFDRIKYHEEKQKEREKGKLLKDSILEALDDQNIIDDTILEDDEDKDEDVNVDDLLKEMLETQDIINEEQNTVDDELNSILEETKDIETNVDNEADNELDILLNSFEDVDPTNSITTNLADIPNASDELDKLLNSLSDIHKSDNLQSSNSTDLEDLLNSFEDIQNNNVKSKNTTKKIVSQPVRSNFVKLPRSRISIVDV
jgi:hypothetical protein